MLHLGNEKDLMNRGIGGLVTGQMLMRGTARHTRQQLLDELDKRWGHDYVTVVIPEFVTPHWWQGVLHNQSALALKLRLLARRDTVVVSVPFHLFDKVEEPVSEADIETIRVEGAPTAD